MTHRQLIRLLLIALLSVSCASLARAETFAVLGGAGSYRNVIRVCKAGPGLRGIQAAIDSVSGESSTNRYLVEVGPGVFEETVTLKSWVDVRGSGPGVTVISYPGSNEFDEGTVLGADNCTLSNLSVLNTGGGTALAKAICNLGVSPTLHRVEARVEAAGANNAICVHNMSGASPHISDFTALVSGAGTYNIALFNQNGGTSPVMVRVRAEADGGNYAYAVQNSANATPRFQGLFCRARGASTTSAAIYNDGGAAPEMNNVQAVVDSDGSGSGYGLYARTAYPVIKGLVIRGSGSGSSRVGIYAYDTSVVKISNLTVSLTNSSGASQGTYLRDSEVNLDHFFITAQGQPAGTFGINSARCTLDLRQGDITVTGGSGIAGRAIQVESGDILNASHVTCNVPNTSGTEIGLYINSNITATLANCNFAGGDYGIYIENYGTHSIQLSNCRVSGGSYSLRNTAAGTVNIGASMLDGSVLNTGTLNCYQCFTAAMASACP